MAKPVSFETRQRQSRAQLSLLQWSRPHIDGDGGMGIADGPDCLQSCVWEHHWQSRAEKAQRHVGRGREVSEVGSRSVCVCVGLHMQRVIRSAPTAPTPTRMGAANLNARP